MSQLKPAHAFLGGAAVVLIAYKVSTSGSGPAITYEKAAPGEAPTLTPESEVVMAARKK